MCRWESYPILDQHNAYKLIKSQINHSEIDHTKAEEEKNFDKFFDYNNPNYYGRVSGKMSKVSNFLIDHSTLETEIKIGKILMRKSNVTFSMNTY